MDDLEKAILIIFDESGTVTSALKSQADAFCQQIKDNPSICSICIEGLRISKLVQVQFWCLQCLHEMLRARYSRMSTDEKNFVRKSVFSMACYETLDNDTNSVKVLDSPPYVKNKLAQVLVTLIYYEYPSIWSSIFLDFLSILSKGGVVIDMFCRVLNVLDDELISQDYPRTLEEGAISGKIKDAMRQQCVGQTVHAWYEIVSLYRNSDPELCSFVLDTMRRYISWIEIGLIANNTFLPLLFELMLVDKLPDNLRCAASGCVLAVVSKRMDPQAKLTLLQSLQMSRVFGLVAGDVDSEFVAGLASLLTGYASELLDCIKNLNGSDLKRTSVELLNEVLPSVFYIMQNCEIDTTFSIVQFLSGYVATMKTQSPLTETQLFHVGQILEVILMQIRFDPMYRDNLDVLDKVGKEEEDRMVEHRKDLLVLLRNVGRVAPDVTQLFIRNSHSDDGKLQAEGDSGEFWVIFGGFAPIGKKVASEDDIIPEKTPPKLYCIAEGQVKEVDGELSKSLLENNKCYLLDCGSEVHVWVGRVTQVEERKAAMQAAEEFVVSQNRPKSTRVTRLIQGYETYVFKSNFDSWPSGSAPSAPEEGRGKVAALLKQQGVGLKGLAKSSPATEEVPPLLEENGKIEVWRINGSAKTPVPKEDIGKFYSGDCYIVLYTYHSTEKKEDYYLCCWIGKDSIEEDQNMAARLATTMFNSLKGRPVQGRVYQGKEPPQFVAIFQPMVVLKGGLSSGYKNYIADKGLNDETYSSDGVALIQISGTSVHNNKAVQVEAVATSLNSNDCFLLQSGSSLFTWHGNQSVVEQHNIAAKIAEFLKPGANLKFAKEGTENSTFWFALGGKQGYNSKKAVQETIRDPHLFAFSFNKGFTNTTIL